MRHSVSKLLATMLALLTALTAPTAALAHQNTTPVSRQQVAFPDLGFEGGTALHTTMTNVIKTLGDHTDSRYFEYTAVANSTTTQVTHNFNVDFADLVVVLFSGTGSGKTLISNPTGAGWTIAAGTSPKTQVAVTTPGSGGPHSFTVEIKEGFGTLATQDASAAAITGGSIAGVSFSSSSATITGGSIAGVDFDGGTAANTSRLTVPKASKTTLDGLTRKEATLAYASDLDKLYVDDGSTLKEVGSGTGQGEKNYASNPSASADTTGWTASGSGITVARTTTAGELPRGSTTGTAFLLTPVSGTTDYVQTCFTLDEADKSKKLKVEFAQRALSGYAAGDIEVRVYSFTSASCGGSATRLALSTDDSTPKSGLPALSGVYQTTFDTTTADYYGVRFYRAAGTTAMAFSDFIAGPGKVVQGAALGDWQVFTPVFSNTGSKSFASSVYGKWRRVGDSMEVWMAGNSDANASGSAATTVVTVALPTGYTIDQTKLANTTAYATDDNRQGECRFYSVKTASQWDYTCDVIPASSTAVQFSSKPQVATPFTYNIGDLNVARAIEMNAHFTVPIAEWAGGGVVVVGADLSYACNDGSGGTAAATTYSTGVVQGNPGGCNFVAVNSTTAGGATGYKVSFATPIQANEQLAFIIYDAGQRSTSDVSLTRLDQNTCQYGMWYDAAPSDAYSVVVKFGNCGRLISGAATYGAATGATWGGITGRKWVLVKGTAAALAGIKVATATASGFVTSYTPLAQSTVKSVSSADYTVTDSDGYNTVLVTTGASNRTITLPAVANNPGRQLTIKKVDNGAGTVTIDTPGSETIDGAAQNVLNAQYAYLTLVSDGTNWNVTHVWDQIATALSAGLSSSASFNSASTSLTPGTWNAEIYMRFTSPNSTWTATVLEFAISTASGSVADSASGAYFRTNLINNMQGVGQVVALNGGQRKITLTSTTTYYSVWQVTYSSATGTGAGWQGMSIYTRVQ